MNISKIYQPYIQVHINTEADKGSARVVHEILRKNIGRTNVGTLVKIVEESNRTLRIAEISNNRDGNSKTK